MYMCYLQIVKGKIEKKDMWNPIYFKSSTIMHTRSITSFFLFLIWDSNVENELSKH